MSSQFSQSRFRSSASPHSRSVSQYIGTSDVEELSDEELLRQVTTLKNELKVLRLENEIIELTILRLDPALMNGVQQAIEYASKLRSSSSLQVASFAKSTVSRFGLVESTLQSTSRLLTSASRRFESSAKIGGTITSGTGPRINVLERSELVSAEMENVVRRLEKTRKKAAKEHALLKAQLEEIGVRVNAVEKATESFNQQVIIDGWDKIAKRIPAEVWIRYMNEWVGLCDKEIGKLRLRTSTLNTQYAKLKGQIVVKAELSENLRPVEFDQLRIENQVALETIEKKMLQLAELKEMTGDANLVLSIHKQAMMEQNEYLTKLQKQINLKKHQKVTLKKEKNRIEIQANDLSKTLDGVKKVRLAYEVPDIMDYVRVKSEVTELKRSIKLLENRYRIQQIALKSLNRRLHSSCFRSDAFQMFAN